MSKESSDNYNDGDIVWVKLGNSWWPGEVKDSNNLPSEVVDFKKPPLAIVKFFDENSYEYVENWSYIYPYNCEKKIEFIKKGMAAFRAKVPHMEKFPKDVSKAEVVIGGNPNILSDPVFLPEKKVDYADIFGTPSPKTKAKGKKSRSNNKSRKDTAHITHRRFLGLDDYKAYICIQYPGKDRIPGDDDDEETIRINKEEEQVFDCHSCSFTTRRLEVMILHKKSHILGDVHLPSTKKVKRPVPRKPRKERTKQKKSSEFVRSESNSSDDELLGAPKEKKRKTKTLGGKKRPKKLDDDKPKKPTDIRSDLLAEWEISEDDLDEAINQSIQEHLDKSFESSATSTFSKTIDDSFNQTIDASFSQTIDDSLNNTNSDSLNQTIESSVKLLVAVSAADQSATDNLSFKKSDAVDATEKSDQLIDCATKEAAVEKIESPTIPTEKKGAKQRMEEAIKSCFDFDDDDEDHAIISTAAVGRKIPRVIPLTERRKSKTLEETIFGGDDEELTLTTREETLKASEDFGERTMDDDIHNAFRELMETTAVPELPEVHNTLKCEQNFHSVKTIKFPDKPETTDSSVTLAKEKAEVCETATKLTNPKKRFVKSFEDFELMQNEIRRKEEEEEICKAQTVKRIASPIESMNDESNSMTSLNNEDDGTEFAKLKTKIMSKIVEEANINEESKHKIMSKMMKKTESPKKLVDISDDGNCQETNDNKSEITYNDSEEVQATAKPKKTSSRHKTPRSKILESYMKNQNDTDKQLKESEEKDKVETIKATDTFTQDENIEERLKSSNRDVGEDIGKTLVPPKKHKWSRRGSHPKKDRNLYSDTQITCETTSANAEQVKAAPTESCVSLSNTDVESSLQKLFGDEFSADLKSDSKPLTDSLQEDWFKEIEEMKNSTMEQLFASQKSFEKASISGNYRGATDDHLQANKETTNQLVGIFDDKASSFEGTAEKIAAGDNAIEEKNTELDVEESVVSDQISEVQSRKVSDSESNGPECLQAENETSNQSVNIFEDKMPSLEGTDGNILIVANKFEGTDAYTAESAISEGCTVEKISAGKETTESSNFKVSNRQETSLEEHMGETMKFRCTNKDTKKQDGAIIEISDDEDNTENFECPATDAQTILSNRSSKCMGIVEDTTVNRNSPNEIILDTCVVEESIVQMTTADSIEGKKTNLDSAEEGMPIEFSTTIEGTEICTVEQTEVTSDKEKTITNIFLVDPAADTSTNVQCDLQETLDELNLADEDATESIIVAGTEANMIDSNLAEIERESNTINEASTIQSLVQEGIRETNDINSSTITEIERTPEGDTTDGSRAVVAVGEVTVKIASNKDGTAVENEYTDGSTSLESSMEQGQVETKTTDINITEKYNLEEKSIEGNTAFGSTSDIIEDGSEIKTPGVYALEELTSKEESTTVAEIISDEGSGYIDTRNFLNETEIKENIPKDNVVSEEVLEMDTIDETEYVEQIFVESEIAEKSTVDVTVETGIADSIAIIENAEETTDSRISDECIKEKCAENEMVTELRTSYENTLEENAVPVSTGNEMLENDLQGPLDMCITDGNAMENSSKEVHELTSFGNIDGSTTGLCAMEETAAESNTIGKSVIEESIVSTVTATGSSHTKSTVEEIKDDEHVSKKITEDTIPEKNIPHGNVSEECNKEGVTFERSTTEEKIPLDDSNFTPIIFKSRQDSVAGFVKNKIPVEQNKYPSFSILPSGQDEFSEVGKANEVLPEDAIYLPPKKNKKKKKTRWSKCTTTINATHASDVEDDPFLLKKPRKDASLIFPEALTHTQRVEEEAVTTEVEIGSFDHQVMKDVGMPENRHNELGIERIERKAYRGEQEGTIPRIEAETIDIIEEVVHPVFLDEKLTGEIQKDFTVANNVRNDEMKFYYEEVAVTAHDTEQVSQIELENGKKEEMSLDKQIEDIISANDEKITEAIKMKTDIEAPNEDVETADSDIIGNQEQERVTESMIIGTAEPASMVEEKPVDDIVRNIEGERVIEVIASDVTIDIEEKIPEAVAIDHVTVTEEIIMGTEPEQIEKMDDTIVEEAIDVEENIAEHETVAEEIRMTNESEQIEKHNTVKDLDSIEQVSENSKESAVLAAKLTDLANKVEIQCATTTEDTFKFSIQTNLSNFSSREELSAIALATLAELKTDAETSDSTVSAIVSAKKVPPFAEPELVPIEGNLTVVSEKDLADGQVEITSEKVISSKKPVMLSSFSMDYSDDSTNTGISTETSKYTAFDSKGTEFNSKAMTKEIKPKIDLKAENKYERFELLDILEGNSEVERKEKKFQPPKMSFTDDICDFEEHIPSQIVCSKKWKMEKEELLKKNFKAREKANKSIMSTTSKLLERLTDAKSKEHIGKISVPKIDVKSMKSPAKVLKSPIKEHKNAISKAAVKNLKGIKSKPVILSEQIIKPATEIGKPVTKPQKMLNDIEDVEAFIIHKDQKKHLIEEPVTPATTAKTHTNNKPAKSLTKVPGKAKILQQTIITPAGDIIQPTSSMPQADDNVFDINSMPIVLSDEILTPESIEKMPIVISSEPEASKTKSPEKVIVSTSPMGKRLTQSKTVAKITSSLPQIPPSTFGNQSMISKPKVPRILQSIGTKVGQQDSALLPNTSKPGKYIIVPQNTTKYIAKKTTMVKRPPASGILAKSPNITSEPTGNKIMIVTNQQGQQQRLLLTPAQQKMLGYQTTQCAKVTKTVVKGNILQKNVLTGKSVTLVEASTSGVLSKSPAQKIVASSAVIATTSQQIITSLSTPGRTIKSTNKRPSLASPKPAVSTVPTTKTPKTILISTKHGQSVRKVQGRDDDLEKQVAEQIEAIKASSGIKFGSQPKGTEAASHKQLQKTFNRRSYAKKIETKPKAGAPPLAGLHASPKVDLMSSPPPLTMTQKKTSSNQLTTEVKTTSDRPLNQLVIQDALGNQTTITEGQILALPSETVDGQPQSYMLVTLDESGNLTPLNNEALMSLDPNLGLGGDLSNMVLQIDQGALSSGTQQLPLAQPAIVKSTLVGEKSRKMMEVPVVPCAAPVVKETVMPRKAPVPITEAPIDLQSIVPSTNSEPGQQLIVTGDPIATQKFLESLTEGTTDLANILANADGNSILIQADGQQILINTNADNQMLLSVNNDNVNASESTEGGGNPIFATQPSKSKDILAAALADTDVFQPDHHAAQSKITSQLSPSNALYPINVGNVLETSLTLSSPIMTPLEVPSTNTKKIPDEEADILTQIPKNVDLPITITDPNISQTVANQHLMVSELPNLELSLPMSETTISTVHTADMNSPSYSYSLSALDEADMTQKPFNSSMPLLNEDVGEVSPKPNEDQSEESNTKILEDVICKVSEDNLHSQKSFLQQEGRFTLGGKMCSSLSEPPPEMFDLPDVNATYDDKCSNDIPSSLHSTPDLSDGILKNDDDTTTDFSTQAESSNDGSCEIPVQPKIIMKSEHLSHDFDSHKRSFEDAKENGNKKCKFD